ncbi:MAG: hypothetical protein ACHQF4_07040 [Sphingobacteriales bacterium]|jgi:hypothetical protein
MAEHNGKFTTIGNKISGIFIPLVDFLAYYTSDGSYVPLSALPNDNGLITRSMLEIALSGIPLLPIIQTEFTAQTGMVITWQTDIPAGQTQTYFELFGNYVESRAYFNGGGTSDPTWTYDGSNNVNIVTFAFGSAQSGWIRF